jgi:hypothetical protein
VKRASITAAGRTDTILTKLSCVKKQTRIYPLEKRGSAKPMQFPDASNAAANMLFPTDGTAFDMLARFIDHEYVDPADMWMRGIAASFGIVKGKAFAPMPLYVRLSTEQRA